ncbi:ppGpp synthetase/RelA/SpoT-type nucleotidyltransferase [Microbacterium foliorum]|uniref:PpGpp synthetase/RelA/SpoT-type nucleotidyltransferase n=2 Tax=Microbacterium foliorum TaxID=104336 RepID=A0ABU1HRX5_9MICO|nr:ppGpp synthetase/RelA/SpoT-type nucleotidyltransferase [Microbacterium foliorum]
MSMTNWVIPEHSRSQVKQAGELIGGGVVFGVPYREARAKIANFRSAHGYPLLSVYMHVRNKANRLSAEAVVARRLKRLPTILDKLDRYPTMNVARMQDLGGCRVILGQVAEVYELVGALYDSKSRSRIVREKDYIAEPQTTGYRGVHLVYEYGASKVQYLGLKIEVQVRTALQHAWATSVETMDLFSGSRLKYDDGDPRMKRYFAVVASLMADHEGTAPVPGAEESADDLRRELLALEAELSVTGLLSGYASIVDQLPSSDRRSTMLLTLWRDTRQLGISVFETQAEAEDHLGTIEALDDENIDAVLVSVNKVEQIQSAYPNYFANTSTFLGFVDHQLDRAAT